MSKPSVDIAALRKYDRQPLMELDEQVERNLQRELENKRRQEEKARKKKAKKRKSR